MHETEKFLNKKEEQEIIEAIQKAERNTSGEIRIHIENHAEKPPLERAQEVFQLLGMEKTASRNGVLFYVGIVDKTFAIVGDEGIDKVVEDDFWESTKDAVISQFKKKNFKEGLVNGILKAGEQLKAYFPYDSEGDINELPDTISRG